MGVVFSVTCTLDLGKSQSTMLKHSVDNFAGVI